jgi:hypothetical protein
VEPEPAISEPQTAVTEPAPTSPPEVVWYGKGKKGMARQALPEHKRELAKQYPNLEFTAVPATEFGDGVFKLEGRPRKIVDGPRETASWVVRNKATGEVLFETYDKKKVKALNTSKYEAVPIEKYLPELNKQAKAANAAKEAAPKAPRSAEADHQAAKADVAKRRAAEAKVKKSAESVSAPEPTPAKPARSAETQALVDRLKSLQALKNCLKG